MKKSSSQLKNTCLSSSVKFAQSSSFSEIASGSLWYSSSGSGVGGFAIIAGVRLGGGGPGDRAGNDPGGIGAGEALGFVVKFGGGGGGGEG